MKIELNEISVRELANGYVDYHEEGVFGYGGKLNIRPKYQREFVYNESQRNKVIDTIQKGFPLNIMYWVKNNDNYEVLDGQQRTISICQYANNEYSINDRAWHNLHQNEKDKILDYKLMIYICEGNDEEKIDWFQTINIAGEKLTDQEILNAIYSGTWTTAAKKIFSKTGCAAYNLANKYLNGTAIRQDYLETAINWYSEGNIKQYMGKHQNDENADELWLYFQSVIHWVEAKFKTYRKLQKGVNWGELYNKFKDKKLDANKIELEIQKLLTDDDITNQKGIYSYILTRNEKYLNIRAFTDNQKQNAYEKQKGICAKCKKHFEYEELEGDHIKPWHEGGQTINENLQMLCKDCNRRKSGK
jgi:hypothetical protein